MSVFDGFPGDVSELSADERMIIFINKVIRHVILDEGDEFLAEMEDEFHRWANAKRIIDSPR